MRYITRQEANEVLHHFGREGWQPGRFVSSLLTAFGCADGSNFNKLRHAYPGYGEAMRMAMHDPNGIEKLQRIAEGVRS